MYQGAAAARQAMLNVQFIDCLHFCCTCHADLSTYYYDNPNPGTSVLLLQSNTLADNETEYHQTYLHGIVAQWQNTEHKCPGPAESVCYTPGGFALINAWGSIRYTAHAAFLGLAFARVNAKAADSAVQLRAAT